MLAHAHQVQAEPAKSASFLYQLSPNELAQEFINIQVGKQKIHALYKANKGKQALGAVILLHDAFAHINDDPIISGLRTYLPNHGWASLSLETPFTTYEALPLTQNELSAEIKTRANEAIQFLREQGFQQIAIIGEGLGATLASHVAANVTDGSILTVVCINSVQHPLLSAEIHPNEILARLEIPVLDLQISTTPLGASYTNNQLRHHTIKAGNPKYTWIHLPANNLHGGATPIKLRIRGWLQRQSSQLPLAP